MKSSKDLIDESKYSELQNTSTLKLDRNNLLKNEIHALDYSELYDRVLVLAGNVEAMMDNIIKALIVDVYQCVQKENVEQQQNMILETVGNHNDSRNIREATVQTLEQEDKIKASTLEVITCTKVSSSARKFYSEVTLQMIKLAKKVIELEKQPIEKYNVITSKKDKTESAKKVSHNVKRKKQQDSRKQVSFE